MLVNGFFVMAKMVANMDTRAVEQTKENINPGEMWWVRSLLERCTQSP